MRKICFVTGTRADYGIMAPIMKEVAKNPDVQLQIIATNAHLSKEYGMTVSEIEADGFNIDYKIDSLCIGGSAASVVRSMAKVEEGLADAFEMLKPDLVVILGDRYEALSSASAAVAFNIPLVHLHGGETTEGAIDDKFRHAITKLADYHFAATPQYAERIVSMGANPDKVFHSGAPGADIIETDLPELREKFIEKTVFAPEEPFILFTFHPVTVLKDNGKKELTETLEALDIFVNQGYKILITMPNSDAGNLDLIDIINKWHVKNPDKIKIVSSLGAQLFHYAMEKAAAMVGNSSASLIEAPSHRLPAVNVGIRQKGRAHGMTVLDSPAEKGRIVSALNAALSLEMKAVIMGQPLNALNPYYKANSSSFIAEKIIKCEL